MPLEHMNLTVVSTVWTPELEAEREAAFSIFRGWVQNYEYSDNSGFEASGNGYLYTGTDCLTELLSTAAPHLWLRLTMAGDGVETAEEALLRGPHGFWHNIPLRLGVPVVPCDLIDGELDLQIPLPKLYAYSAFLEAEKYQEF